MSDDQPDPQIQIRPLGTTELSWCKAVPGGTGITVLALHLSKTPTTQNLQNALHKLQTHHPILNSTLHWDPTSNTFSSLIIPPTPQLQIQIHTQSTAHILQQSSSPTNNNIPPLQLILEHEMNTNDTWRDPNNPNDAPVFVASVYKNIDNEACVVTLRLHTSVCDRTGAVAALKELMVLMSDRGGAGVEGEVSLGIEEYVPSGKVQKPFWARGVDMLGYSLNSLRLTNLPFEDTVSPRGSRVVKLELSGEDTGRVLSFCQEMEIKLCGVLAAAGLIAARSLKEIPDDQWEKYAVVTLMDCRSVLEPVLSSEHIGFYHSAILNTHDVKGGENFSDLAKRVYMSFANARSNNKHFSDMADLNFLMCKAIENPGLTPSASLRTSLISVFEDPMIDNSTELHQELGLEGFIGCASVHGVGPSIAVFDTIRDGKLDCTCVYPFPLHSREQMQEFVDEMKRIILSATT